MSDSPAPPPPIDEPVDPAAARAMFFTDALEQTDRMLHAAQAMRLQMMLAGFEAMILEEEAELQHPIHDDDPAVRAFHLHQARVLRTSRFDVQRQLEQARLLRDRLPRTWQVFLAGGCSQHVAGIVADQIFGLDDEQTEAIDEAAESLVQSERPGQVERRLERLREDLAPDATLERHERASNRAFVRARPEPDGQGVLEIHSTAADVAAAYDAIRQSAVAAHGVDGECRTLGQLMAHCAIDMVLQSAATGAIPADGPAYPMERLGDARVPGRKKVDVTLLVTVPADVATGAVEGTGSLAGMGSIDGEVVRRIVEHTATWTRVLVDPVDDAVLGIDSHERYIPSGLKKLIHARNTTCVGDDCGMPAHRTDLDHLVRVEHDGRTRHDNLQPLCRASHQMKDEGYEDVRMLDDGTIRWANKWGGRFTVAPALKVRTRTVREECPF